MIGYAMRTVTGKNVSLDKVIKRSVICLLGIATIRTMRVSVDGPTSGNTIPLIFDFSEDGFGEAPCPQLNRATHKHTILDDIHIYRID
jgi:hypothetical protein